jgi:membrane associated rhomboid family serine protease
VVGDPLFVWFAFWPIGLDGVASGSLAAPWQWLTYAFLHGSVAHLAFNMFGLWMFGSDLERAWGSRRFALAYFASVFFGALAHFVVVGVLGSDPTPVVGASAGVFGLLLGFALVFPERRIIALLLPIPLPSRVFVLLYAALELTLGVSGSQSGVAHFAHLGGLVGGWLAYRRVRSGASVWRRR